jgi:hypothetical protein
MNRTPCVRCGMLLHTGEGRVTIALTAQECVDLAWDAFNGDRLNPVIDRLLCAAGLLDEALEKRTHAEMPEARSL